LESSPNKSSPPKVSSSFNHVSFLSHSESLMFFQFDLLVSILFIFFFSLMSSFPLTSCFSSVSSSNKSSPLRGSSLLSSQEAASSHLGSLISSQSDIELSSLSESVFIDSSISSSSSQKSNTKSSFTWFDVEDEV